MIKKTTTLKESIPDASETLINDLEVTTELPSSTLEKAVINAEPIKSRSRARAVKTEASEINEVALLIENTEEKIEETDLQINKKIKKEKKMKNSDKEIAKKIKEKKKAKVKKDKQKEKEKAKKQKAKKREKAKKQKAKDKAKANKKAKAKRKSKSKKKK